MATPDEEQDGVNRMIALGELDMVELIVPLGVVPTGAKVRKVGGSAEYTVRRQIKFYGEGVGHIEATAGAGCSFLTRDGGSVNSELDSKLFVWKVATRVLVDLLDEARQHANSK